MELHISNQPSKSLVAANATTKDELLRCAKNAIEAGKGSLHDAAEALAAADDFYSATQREMAEAVGMSAAWVNKLLKWHRSGYKDHSPFGPTTKSGRVEHAQHRAKVCRKRKAPAGDTATPGPKDRHAETLIDTSSASDETLLAQFKIAVDNWVSKMSDEAKREAVSYVVEKSGVGPS